MTLNNLIDEVGALYGVPALTVGLAKQLDRRALNYLGAVVGQRACKLSPLDTNEVTKWGISNDLSRYPEIRALA